MRVIEHSHKDLFINFRNRGITLEQLKSRVAERRFGIKYVVLDDLLPHLLERFKDPIALEKFKPTMKKIYGENPCAKEINRELKPYEVNERCLNSLTHEPKQEKIRESHFFKNTDRAHSFNPHRNVAGLSKDTVGETWQCKHENAQLKKEQAAKER